MNTQKQRMLAGELYDPLDSKLSSERRQTRLLFRQFNNTTDEQPLLRKELLKQLIGGYKKDLVIEPPFYCDYGSNIAVGSKVFFNFNCTVLDVCQVTIGDRTLFGPNVQIYAATHPMDAGIRADGLENGKPVVIGSDVWVGGGAIICPGVTIGDRSVIGAGSVVTRNIPSDSFAAGNPCKVIKQIDSGNMKIPSRRSSFGIPSEEELE